MWFVPPGSLSGGNNLKWVANGKRRERGGCNVIEFRRMGGEGITVSGPCGKVLENGGSISNIGGQCENQYR